MPPSRRLVRRRPLLERIKAYLDPLDFLLWLSEELETSDWEAWQKAWAVPLGIGLNLGLMVARANAGGGSGSGDAYDDVFGDGTAHASIMSWLATLLGHTLTLLSFANAAYAFQRRRHYRLFEAPIDAAPSTPSARRVKVDSSPASSSSPLRFLGALVSDSTAAAAARAHPDPRRDVWEVAVWDPVPLSLELFCLFSPGHVAVHWMFLPAAAADPRPSVAAVKALAMALLLTAQLRFLCARFVQQARDNALIHKEVLHEYDAKFVHPRTHPRMRDVATQLSAPDESDAHDGVRAGRPVTVVNRGFRTAANPNYRAHVDPDAAAEGARVSQVDDQLALKRAEPQLPSPFTRRDLLPRSPAQHHRDFSSPAALSDPRRAAHHAPYRASTGSGGDGGSLGVYSHSQSPLKKSASTNFAPNQRLARLQQSPLRRESGRF